MKRFILKGTIVGLLLSIAMLCYSCARPSAPEPRQGRWISSSCFRMDSIELLIEHQNDSLHIVRLSTNGVTHDSLLLPYPLYRIDCGDLTGNGLPEVVLGVIKAARYWPTPQKRLFVYHLYDGHYIRPLWLGSRVANPLHDFRIDRDSLPAQVCTEEWADDTTLIHRRYTLSGFGLKVKANINL